MGDKFSLFLEVILMEKQIIIEKLNGHDKEAIVGKCHKKPGEQVAEGEVLITVESSKGSFAIKSDYEGKLIKLDIDEGDTVKKGQSIGLIEASKEPAEKKPAYSFGIAKAVDKDMAFDVIVIGGGPGGYVAAIRAAQSGLKTAVIEADKLGGTCLNYGCIPTKAMISSIGIIDNIKQAHNHGISTGEIEIDFTRLIERKNEVVDQLVGGIEHLMGANDIEFIHGKAEILDDKKIKVNTKKFNYKLEYKNLILALGSKPSYLPIEGADSEDILTSTELLSLREIPKSLVIIGGGVIGMEFAFIYRALGTDVSVVEFMPQILNVLDSDVAQVVRDEAIERGIKIYEGAKATSIKTTLDGMKLLELELDNKTMHICAEKLAMAVGRKANVDSLDLEKLGIELNERKNGIKVNEYMQTNQENIYAIGDVTNIIQLAHIASHQGIVAADHIAGGMHKIDYSAVPSAIFTMPEIGTVGLCEKQARAEKLDVIVSKFPFIANGKAIAMGESKGFVKLIADRKTRIILGGSVAGPHATDLMAIISNFVSMKITIDEAKTVIYAHPTTSEAIHEAILMLEGKGIHFA